MAMVIENGTKRVEKECHIDDIPLQWGGAWQDISTYSI